MLKLYSFHLFLVDFLPGGAGDGADALEIVAAEDEAGGGPSVGEDIFFVSVDQDDRIVLHPTSVEGESPGQVEQTSANYFGQFLRKLFSEVDQSVFFHDFLDEGLKQNAVQTQVLGRGIR